MSTPTTILNARDHHPDPAAFARIGSILDNGGIIVYPTETFYALGAAADAAAGIEKIYRLKERDRGKPLSVVVAELGTAESCAEFLPAVFGRLAGEFWPGPLTLIVKARAGFPPALLGPGGSIAMRVPGSAWLRELLANFGRPVTATSANISGDAEISRGADAIRLFEGKVDLIVDGGDTPGGLPSTIVDLTRVPPRVIRAGAVPALFLAPFLGPN